MRTSRFYTRELLDTGAVLTLDEETSHYLLRVLRLRAGDRLILFNGDGSEYHAVLTRAERNKATVFVGERDRPQRESLLHVVLGQGIPRSERMDFVLQKSVELGAAAIAPVCTIRSQVRLTGKRLQNRFAHWQGILRSACEQSNRVLLPALEPVQLLPEWLVSRTVQETQLGLVLDPAAPRRLRELKPATSVSILVGPEGGLEPQEIELAESHGFQRVGLGPRVLRTETAAIAALAAVQALWGDL